MEKKNWFKWKHYQPDIILLTVDDTYGTT
ncbi:Uncharacterized protein BWINRA5_00217 [Bacillus mycoides]|nr:Uncharacterized protein BWINRA5_00217 [Bacillus mycoides]